MKKVLVIAVLLAGAAGAYYYYRPGSTTATGPAAGPDGAGGRGGGMGMGRGSGRPALTVDTAPVARGEVIEYITVVATSWARRRWTWCPAWRDVLTR